MGAAGSRVLGDTQYEEQLLAGVLPASTALDVHNVLSKYMFDAGKTSSCIDEDAEDTPPDVAPTFEGAACRNPLSDRVDHYMLVKFTCALDGKTGFRKPMRFIFVLDVSGSMGSYYDMCAPSWPPDGPCRCASAAAPRPACAYDAAAGKAASTSWRLPRRRCSTAAAFTCVPATRLVW